MFSVELIKLVSGIVGIYLRLGMGRDCLMGTKAQSEGKSVSVVLHRG
jgi:hypothetical protein